MIIIISIIMSIAVPIHDRISTPKASMPLVNKWGDQACAGCCEIAEISGKNMAIHGIYLWLIMGNHGKIVGKQG